MAISETDLHLRQSERMTDFTDGGGKMSSNEVVDGVINNAFNDISDVDRWMGRASIRKVFASVETSNVDTYLGAHVIVTDPPDDPNVNLTMFSTHSWVDERDSARNYIESYSIPGPESPWILWGDHVEGQKMLMLFSRSNAANAAGPSSDKSLEVGDIILLSVEKTGFAADYQYLRVSKINSRVTEQITDSTGAYFKDVLTVEVSTRLQQLFKGSSPLRSTPTRNSSDSSPTVLRNTSVADAAQYYGVKKSLSTLSIGDTTVSVGNPYIALVPSAQAETPIVDVLANITRLNYVAASASTISKSVTLSGTVSPDYAGTFYMGRGISLGGLSLTIMGVAYKDDSQGAIVLATGATGTYSGIVDYANGSVTLTKSSSWASVAVVATAIPATVIADSACTDSIAVTLNNRAFNWVNSLHPVPAPGTLLIDFRAMNKWYRLYDDGQGHISGDIAGVGAGTINYATGSVLVTLAVLPDVGSQILYAWATPLTYAIQTYATKPPKPGVDVTVSNVPVTPGSVVITWTDSGLSKTAGVAVDGTISGHATGRFLHATGKGHIIPTNIPVSGTVFTLNYTQNTDKVDSFSVTGDSSGNIAITLTQLPVKPGSVELTYTLVRQKISGNWWDYQPAHEVLLGIFDNGVGGLIDASGASVTGSINYTTGVITADLTLSYNQNKISGFLSGEGSAGATTQLTTAVLGDVLPANTTLTAHYNLDSTTPVAKIDTASLTSLKLDLTTVSAEDLVAGSLMFSFAGSTFIDRSGLLYTAHDATNNSATLAGSVDYQTGLADVTHWTGGTPTLSIASALSVKGRSTVVGVSGHAPSAPLSTGQFQLTCTGFDDTAITCSADNNGDIAHEWVEGHIDWLSGVYNIRFGKWVLDSTLSSDVKTNSGWYSTANIVAGNIWVPLLVKPETIRYNAVLVSYIPLNADILGLETVRLPQDGRVPIFRVGDIAILHNTQTLTLSNPAVAGSVHNCGRTLLSYAKVFDATGAVVATSKYTTNLDAGTVTMANPLDLTGYTQPLHIEHRIEDGALISDVQITGQVKLMKPIRHAYPANTSFLSSALVIGDMKARITGFFDQSTWTNMFSDTLIGSAAAGTFNDTLFPIVTTNAGAYEDRIAIVFTGSTIFSCYSEAFGLIAQGNTGVNFAPANPITSVPYFTIDYRGWGTGWASGNAVRFNVIAANFPIQLVRTTLQSDPTVYTDNFKLQIRGGAN